MNVLVLAPHPDDEAIGCGGALCLHADKGDRVAVVFLTSGELGLKHLPRDEAWKIRETEARAAAKILGVHDLTFLRGRDWQLDEDIPQMAAALRPVLERELPQIIYLPHSQEWHPDHKASVRITKTCLQELSLSPELRAYEVWTPIQEHDDVVDITHVWERKLSAIRAHASQIATWPYERAARGLAQFRGAMAGKCEFAEVFKRLPAV